MALIQGCPHYTSMQCKRESWIGILNKNEYNEILGQYQNQKIKETLKFLQQIQLFEKWSKSRLTRML